MAPFWHRQFIFREFSTQKRVSSKSLKPFIKSVFMQSDKNYSTIVATLPDPTVRPPSRLNVNYIYLESLDFTCFLFAHISCFAVFLVVFEIFRAILEPNEVF